MFIDKLYETLIEKPVKNELETPSHLLEGENPSHPSQAQKNECLYRVPYVSEDDTILCSRFYLTKAKIKEVSVDFCNHCYELQQRLKTSGIPTSSPIPSMYKKPEKIYCIDDTLWIDPLKNQAKCHICKTKNFRMWAECQQHQAKRSNQ